jgi:carbonic anhydrase
MQKNRMIFILLIGALAPAPVPSWAQSRQTAQHVRATRQFSAGFQKWRTPWSYQRGENGPEHWARLDPAYTTCATGRKQSPIDIRETVKRKLPALRFAFRNGPVNIINNGYAVRVDYTAGSGDSLTVSGKSYELTQFHFHHPGEEHINGSSYDMVLHLMYQSRAGEIVGVAVPLKRGKANDAIARLWSHMPRMAGKYHVIPDFTIDPAGMLPNLLGYYRYDGSVSAPPCNEPVTWFVLKTPVEMSAEEIGAYATLFPHDVRPIQPMNGRIVLESE